MSSLRERIEQLRSSKSSAVPRAEPVRRKKGERKASGAEAQAVTYKIRRRPVAVDEEHYQRLKSHTHRELLEVVDLSILKELDKKEVEKQIRNVAAQILDRSGAVLSQRERTELVREIVDEVVGYGALEPLLEDSSVSDILVNGPKQVYVERGGKLQLTDVTFAE